MSKNKFFKKLLIAGLCAVTATAMIGATACNPDGGDDGDDGGEGHVHNYATEWSSDASGHWYACLNSGHAESYNKIAHVDEDGDGECDECGYDMSEEEEDPAPVVNATEKFAIDVKDLSASIDDGAELKANTGVYAAGALTTIDKNGSSLYNNEAISFTKAIKTGGIAKQDTEGKITNAVKLVVEKDNSTIVVYAGSGSSGSFRSGVLKDSEFSEVERYSVGDGNSVASLVFVVKEAGTYYFGGADKGDGDDSSGGVYIYHISVWEDGKLNETVVESKQESAADCETEGNITYTKSGFGRYFNSKGEPVPQGKTTSSALGHDYSVDMDTLKIPEKDEKGSVEVICANDPEHNVTVELPELSSDNKYEVTTKDEVPDAPLQDGEAWYSFAIPDKTDSEGHPLVVGFAAEYIEPVTYQDTVLYSSFLSGTVNIGKDNKTSFADGLKIYGRTNLTTELTEWSDETYNVTANDDALTLIDKGTGDESKKSTFAYIVFDEAYTSGVYKIAGKINLISYSGTNATTASKWDPLQLIAAGSETNADTFASMTTDGDKKLGVSSGVGTGSVAGTGYAYEADTDYDFEFIIDLDNKEVTLTIFVNGASVYSQYVSITAEQWSGFRLQTGDSADRTIVLSNLVISQRTVVDNSAENQTR